MRRYYRNPDPRPPPTSENPNLTHSWVNRGRMDPFVRGRVAAKVGEVVRMGGGQVECADE
jgi:hypothetical protein